MAEFVLDAVSQQRCEALLEKYKKRFGHIKPNELKLVKDVSSESSRFHAVTQLIPPYYYPFTKYKVIIKTFDCSFGQLKRKAKILVLFHELMHIGWNEDKNKYRLIRHDVEDFQELLRTYGLDWTNRTDLPDLLLK